MSILQYWWVMSPWFWSSVPCFHQMLEILILNYTCFLSNVKQSEKFLSLVKITSLKLHFFGQFRIEYYDVRPDYKCWHLIHIHVAPLVEHLTIKNWFKYWFVLSPSFLISHDMCCRNFFYRQINSCEGRKWDHYGGGRGNVLLRPGDQLEGWH